jgi:hypothetical protein
MAAPRGAFGRKRSPTRRATPSTHQRFRSDLRLFAHRHAQPKTEASLRTPPPAHRDSGRHGGRIDTNDTAKGRVRNRRVEFVILDEENIPGEAQAVADAASDRRPRRSATSVIRRSPAGV